jgi:membrane protease YdiL (CAAX protease family)
MREMTNFENKMTRGEMIAGLIYLPLHFFILPLFLGIYATVATSPVDEVTMNVIFYIIGIIFVLVFIRKFLRTSFDPLMDDIPKNILTIIIAYFCSFALTYGASILVFLILGDTENPNNELIDQMAGKSFGAVLGMSVFLAPIVEEVLFRGTVFGVLHKKNRILAYVVSIVLFSFYHVWQYVLVYMDIRMLIYIIQYIPVSFVLAWCYERSGSIWVPIFLHMIINAVPFIFTGI